MKAVVYTRKPSNSDTGCCPYSKPGNDILNGEWEIDRLTDRERQVLLHLAGGPSNEELATLLGIAERTVKAHISRIMIKLGQNSRLQVAVISALAHHRLCPSPTCHIHPAFPDLVT